MKCSPPVVASTGATLAYRPKVVGFVMKVVRELAMLPGHFLFAAQVLDISGFFVICHDLQQLRYTCTSSGVKLCENPLERIGIYGQLSALVDGATLFLERATTDDEPVLEEDVFREECRLLHALQSGLRSCSNAQISTRVSLVHFFSGSMQKLLENSLKSYCYQCTSQKRGSCQCCGDQRMAVCVDPCVSNGCRWCKGQPVTNLRVLLLKFNSTAR